MGASICKTVKVNSLSVSRGAYRQDASQLVSVAREPVEHEQQECLPPYTEGDRKTDEVLQKAVPNLIPHGRRSPQEHEDTTNSPNSRNESVREDRPGPEVPPTSRGNSSNSRNESVKEDRPGPEVPPTSRGNGSNSRNESVREDRPGPEVPPTSRGNSPNSRNESVREDRPGPMVPPTSRGNSPNSRNESVREDRPGPEVPPTSRGNSPDSRNESVREDRPGPEAPPTSRGNSPNSRNESVGEDRPSPEAPPTSKGNSSNSRNESVREDRPGPEVPPTSKGNSPNRRNESVREDRPGPEVPPTSKGNSSNSRNESVREDRPGPEAPPTSRVGRTVSTASVEQLSHDDASGQEIIQATVQFSIQDTYQTSIPVQENDRASVPMQETDQTSVPVQETDQASAQGIVHASDQMIVLAENSVISRENEAMQEKGDRDESELCINTRGDTSLQTANQHLDEGHVLYREHTGDACNIRIADREIRLKGVISKCCESYTKDDVLFVEVPAYKAARDQLLKYGMLTLTSSPGEGKTLLARHLLLDIVKRSGHPDVRMDEVIFASTPDDWKDHIDPNKRQFVLIEDIFGISNLSKYRLDMWRPVLDTIARLVSEQSGKLCVVVTSRTHILEEAKELIKDCRFLDESAIVNLADFPLSSEVKKEILLRHVNDLSEKEIREIIGCNIPHGFPYYCKIFSSTAHFRQKGSAFFRNPVGYIKDEVESLRRTDVVKYCALVMCMLNDGHISKADLDITQLDEAGKTRFRDILQLTEVPSEASTTSLIEALDNITYLYLVNCKDTYRFMHPCLLEVVTQICSKFIPGAIVKHCSPTFLHERVRIRSKQKRPDGSFVVLLEKEQFKFLAWRFYEEVKAKRIKSVVQHEACRTDEFVDFFKCFLENECLSTKIVSYYDSSIRSILYWCAWTGSYKLFVYVLHGVKSEELSPGYLNMQKSMSLVAASFFGFRDIVETLLNSITEVNFHDEIHDKRANSKYEVFGFLLGRLMYIDPTPLQAAVCGGFIDVVDRLLYHQTDVNAKTSDGTTPLHIAVCADHVDIVDKLLNYQRTDVNVSDVYGRTPLHIAAGVSGLFDAIPKEFAMERMTSARNQDWQIRKQNKLRIAKALIEKGASVNCQDMNKDTPMHLALTSNNIHLAETLISSGFDVCLQNMCGETSLHLAAKFGQTAICRLLTANNADVNCSNSIDKTTPLHVAVMFREAETVKYLVEIAGADIQHRDKEKKNPLDIAKHCDFIEAISILETNMDSVTAL
ncbi:uncharacterized protein [Argopecten irradians]|uniref:uncharacterized protein isoform X2 n=1 Tax=Argopecten irradians TaxID=31199 RepID=UPI00371F66A4